MFCFVSDLWSWTTSRGSSCLLEKRGCEKQGLNRNGLVLVPKGFFVCWKPRSDGRAAEVRSLCAFKILDLVRAGGCHMDVWDSGGVDSSKWLEYRREGSETRERLEGKKSKLRVVDCGTFLISNVLRLLNVVCFLLGNSPAHKIQTPGNYLEESTQRLRNTVSLNLVPKCTNSFLKFLYFMRFNVFTAILGWLHTCNVTAYRNTLSWQLWTGLVTA